MLVLTEDRLAVLVSYFLSQRMGYHSSVSEVLAGRIEGEHPAVFSDVRDRYVEQDVLDVLNYLSSCPKKGHKWVPAYEGCYSATREGQVFSWYRDKRASVKREIKSHMKQLGGRYYVTPSFRGKGFSMPRCRVILWTFVGPPPDDQEDACYIDGDSTNDRLDNLKWVSRSENIHNAIRTQDSSGKRRAKFLPHQKERMVELYKTGDYFQQDIAEMYGCTQAAVSYIISKYDK